MNKSTYLIIGASAAGIAAAKKIRSLDVECDIICFTDEQEFPYNKCLLVDWIAQEKTETDVQLHTKEFFSTQRITLKQGVRVTAIDRENQTITTHDGQYHYTKLLIATGASPITLASLGYGDYGNVIPFYTAADTQKIIRMIQSSDVKNIVIIGGGISGIECADALKKCGKNITVLERGSHILSRHVTHTAAQVIQQKAAEYGITIVSSCVITSLQADTKGNLSAIVLADGTTIPADCVITALGSKANLAVADTAQLSKEHGALVTTAYMQTNDPLIYAAGDCALVLNSLTQQPMRSVTWPDAVVQGMVAGTAMAALSVEGCREYKGIVPVTVSHFFGYHFVSCQVEAIGNAAYRVEIGADENGYSSIAYDQDNVVKGFILFKEEVAYTHLKQSLLTNCPLR